MPLPDTNPPVTCRRLVLLFVTAVILRAAYGGFEMWRSGDPAALTFPDEVQYWSMSRELRAGGLLTDELGFHAGRMPLYPGLLALFPTSADGVVGARTCQWIVGGLVAPLVALLAARAVGPRTALPAGLIVAADPALVGLSSLLLTEAPFVTALTALWWAGWPLVERRAQPQVWRHWVLTGLLSALCVYVRPSTVGLVLIWTGFLAARQGIGRARTWAGIGIVLGIVIVSLVPWAVRNQRVTGHWCWLTYRGGISLYDGVGPQATGASNLGPVKNMPAVAGLDEAAWDQWFHQQAWEAIRSDPWRIVGLAGVKLARTWSPILHADELRSGTIRVLFAAWSIALFGLAFGGGVMLRRRPAVLVALLLPAAYLSALHSVFVGSVRYRAGAIPALAILAAVVVSAVVGAAARRKEGIAP